MCVRGGGAHGAWLKCMAYPPAPCRLAEAQHRLTTLRGQAEAEGLLKSLEGEWQRLREFRASSLLRRGQASGAVRAVVAVADDEERDVSAAAASVGTDDVAAVILIRGGSSGTPVGGAGGRLQALPQSDECSAMSSAPPLLSAAVLADAVDGDVDILCEMRLSLGSKLLAHKDGGVAPGAGITCSEAPYACSDRPGAGHGAPTAAAAAGSGKANAEPGGALAGAAGGAVAQQGRGDVVAGVSGGAASRLVVVRGELFQGQSILRVSCGDGGGASRSGRHVSFTKQLELGPTVAYK